MPYIDPEEANQDVVVRFPGDPYPQPVEHNTFDRRESAVGEILGDSGLYQIGPVSEIEALMAAPGENPETWDEVQPYSDLVQDEYEKALAGLTAAQREAWDLERDGLSQRQAADRLGINRNATFERLRAARRKISGEMAWVIDPVLKSKYRQPKPEKPARPMAETLTLQHVGAYLARSDNDDAARWQVARALSKAIDLGVSPNELVRRTQILPVRLADLVTEYRNG